MNTIFKHCTITIQLLARWYRVFQSRYMTPPPDPVARVEQGDLNYAKLQKA